MGAERQLLKIMTRGVDWVERAAELVAPEDFDDPYHRAIFLALLDEPELRAPPESMDPVAAQRFDEILSDSEDLAHGIDVFAKSVNRIRGLALRRRVAEVQRDIEAATDEQVKLDLAATKSKLAAELRELDPTDWASGRRPVDRNPNEPNR
jgi:replicative DNA helicase